MPRPSPLSSFWIFSFFLSFSACCVMSLQIATAGGINTLGGCCAKLAPKCRGTCGSQKDARSWRNVPDYLIFERKSLSKKVCGPCRKSTEYEDLVEAAKAAEAARLWAAEAVAARVANLQTRVPLQSAPRASGESFDDEVNRYVLIT
jgi:hypothetical protein